MVAVDAVHVAVHAGHHGAGVGGGPGEHGDGEQWWHCWPCWWQDTSGSGDSSSGATGDREPVFVMVEITVWRQGDGDRLESGGELVRRLHAESVLQVGAVTIQSAGSDTRWLRAVRSANIKIVNVIIYKFTLGKRDSISTDGIQVTGYMSHCSSNFLDIHNQKGIFLLSFSWSKMDVLCQETRSSRQIIMMNGRKVIEILFQPLSVLDRFPIFLKTSQNIKTKLSPFLAPCTSLVWCISSVSAKIKIVLWTTKYYVHCLSSLHPRVDWTDLIFKQLQQQSC